MIALENVRLFQELQARNRELTESLEQQTATGAILRVISGSPTDIQPVLDAVAESATRLCEARDVSIALVDQDVLRVVASHGPMARWWPDEGIPISRGSVTGRAVVERRTIHIHDLASESELEYPEGKAYQRQGGHRTNMAVPLLREGVAIGVIAVRREEVRPFTDRQIGLLETFADQAVIAIENVRLFQELQARNRELTEALEQQTATGEILRVISSSPTDLEPVMDAVTRNATRLARADHALIGEAAEGRIRWLATSGCPLVSAGPPISRQLPSGRAILDCQTTQVEDVTELTEDFPGVRRAYDEFGVRTILATPLVREGLAIGVLLVRRTTMRSFTGKEIELLRTFADQAVIAIENVRLFTELGARNRDLTEALEQQTATAEILGVISRSPTDLDPVLKAVARNASRLCGAANVSLYRVEGGLMRKVAEEGPTLTTLRVGETRPITRTTISGRTIADRTTIHVSDYQSPDMAREYPDVRRDTGIRTTIGIPLLREGVTIGAFTAYRTESRPFSEREIALLQTFADQAVIAIENVRLFTELEARNRDLTEALEQQTATAEILRVISSSPTDVQPVFDTIVESVARLCDGVFTTAFQFDGELIRPVAYHRAIGPRESRCTGGCIRGRPAGTAWSHARSTSGLSSTWRTSSATQTCRRRRESWRGGRLPEHPCGAHAAGRQSHRRARDRPRRVEREDPALLGARDRAAPDVRRPGGDRDRERAAVHGARGAEPRADRVARAADGDRRDPARHLELAHRRSAGVRCHRGEAPRGCVRRRTRTSTGSMEA